MSSPRSPVSVAPPRPRPADEEADLLACRLTPEQITDFLQDRAPGIILNALAPALEDDIGPLRCTISRSKLKPGSRLTVAAAVHAPTLRSRPVTAIWGALPAQLTGAPGDPVPPVQVREAFTSLRVSAEGGAGIDVSVFVSPLDPSFPSLVALHDPEHLADVLRAQGVEVCAPDISVVPLRYRPGQRHVLRLDLAGSGRSIFAKCYRDDTGARAAAAWAPVQAALTEWGGPVAPVQPVGYVPADRLMLWEGSSGAVLGEVLATSLAPVRTAGAALRVIHDSGVAAEHRAQRSDPGSETAATLRSCEHVTLLLPERGPALVELATAALRRLDETPSESGHRLHGDYKCDNILTEGDGLRLLDLDRVTVGDPALDLGKMTADLRWWAATRGKDIGPLMAAFLDGYGPCPEDRLRRAACYDVLFMLRSIGRRIPLHEPGWAERVDLVLAATNHEGVDR